MSKFKGWIVIFVTCLLMEAILFKIERQSGYLLNNTFFDLCIMCNTVILLFTATYLVFLGIFKIVKSYINKRERLPNLRSLPNDERRSKFK